MNLLTINYKTICAVKDVLDMYNDVFDDKLGTLPGTVPLTIDESVTPVAVSACRVSISLKNKVATKLQELERDKC